MILHHLERQFIAQSYEQLQASETESYPSTPRPPKGGRMNVSYPISTRDGLDGGHG